MTYRMLKSVVVVAIAWAVTKHLEDLARYLRMRDLSRPDHRPPI